MSRLDLRGETRVMRILLSLTLLLSLETFADEFLSTVDEVIGKTVDSIAQEDEVTGALTLNVVQSENAFITGMRFFLQGEIELEKQGIYALEKTDPTYLRAKRLYDRVIEATHYRGVKGLKFEVYESDEVNAYATGGGHVAIFKGLLDRMKDNEVAYVIGHELAHNAASHPFENASTLKVNELARRDLRYGYAEAFTNVNEQEADRLGILYASLAGIDPESSVTAWTKFISNNLSEYAYFRTHPANRERAALNQQTARKVRQYYKPNTLNPDTEKLLECNVLYCARSGERVEDGKGGGILKALELIAVTVANNQNAKDELAKQKQEIAYSAPRINWAGSGYSPFWGIVDRHPPATSGISFGLAGNQGVFYYSFNNQVLEGRLSFYSQDQQGYWYRWSDGHGRGNLYLRPFNDGSLRGTIYIDNGSASGQMLGEWVGYSGSVN